MRAAAGLFLGNNGGDLRHAERDASAMRLALASSRSIIRDPGNAVQFLGPEATRANVEGALAQMAPLHLDAFVLFVAGHGDRRSVLLADDSLRFEELVGWFQLFEARRIIVILDTCGSGGLVDLVKSSGLGGVYEAETEVAWLEALASARPGIRVLAAVRATQNAREPILGAHGFFTGALLQSMTELRGSFQAGQHRFVSDQDLYGSATKKMRAKFGRAALPQILGSAGPIPLVMSDGDHVFGGAWTTLQATGGHASVVLHSMARRYLPTTVRLVLETAQGKVIWSGSDVHLPETELDDQLYQVDATTDLRESLALCLERAVDPLHLRRLRWRAYALDVRGRGLGAVSEAWTDDPYWAGYLGNYGPRW